MVRPYSPDPRCVSSECGLRPLVSVPVPSRVVGGQDALPGAWPWQVSVQYRQDSMSWHVCGGAIIDSRWVLTAAHCFGSQSREVRNLYVASWVVVVGLHQRSSLTIDTRVLEVKRIIGHHGYDEETLQNDIALLLLWSRVDYSPYVQPICLPSNATLLTDVDTCYITGWGAVVVDGPAADILQEAVVNLISHRVCNQGHWYDGLITRKMQCAGYDDGSADGCQGDSGGPLQCFDPREERFYLMGISSFGVQCGLPRKVGVYTRSHEYSDWIVMVRALNGARARVPLPSLLLTLTLAGARR
ncbi:acrosin-like [Mustelus asterias]